MDGLTPVEENSIVSRRTKIENRQVLVLYPSRFAQELLRLVGDGVEPSHTNRSDLGLQLHWQGLLNMTRKRGEYTIEHVREAFEDSKTVRGSVTLFKSAVSDQIGTTSN